MDAKKRMMKLCETSNDSIFVCKLKISMLLLPPPIPLTNKVNDLFRGWRNIPGSVWSRAGNTNPRVDGSKVAPDRFRKTTILGYDSVQPTQTFERQCCRWRLNINRP